MVGLGPISDQLADTWRWWIGPGALLSIAYLVEWVREQRAKAASPLDRWARQLLAVLLGLAMGGFLVAGTIIPFASDGRVPGYDENSVWFRAPMALVWLLWGCCAWGTSIVLAARRSLEKARHLAAASVVWWWAMFIATGVTVNAAG